MSDYERGPYTPPSETPLAFDPRRPVRGAGPVPVTLIVSGVVLVLLIGAVAFLYRGGLKSPAASNSLVGTPLPEIKSPAPAEAASNDAAPGLTIYKTDASGSPIATNAAPAFVAPPEQPMPRPVVVAKPVTPKPVAPVAAHDLKPATLPPVTQAATTPAPAHVAAAPVPAKPPVATPAAAAGGTTGWVQIGAFSSTTLAEKGWDDVAKLKPAAMGGKGIQVETIDKGGQTFYRTFVTGFGSKAAAVAFCNDLKAASHPCIVK